MHGLVFLPLVACDIPNPQRISIQFNSISACWEQFFGYSQLLLQMVVVAPLVHVRQGRPGIECRIKPFRGQQALALRRENGKVAELRPGVNCLKGAWKLTKSYLWVRTTKKVTHQKMMFINFQSFPLVQQKQQGTCTCPPSLPPKTWIVPAMVAAATYARPGQA